MSRELPGEGRVTSPEPTEGLHDARLLPNSTVSDEETSVEHSATDKGESGPENLLSRVEGLWLAGLDGEAEWLD